MGRIVTQVKLTNFADPNKTLAFSALVDTGAAYITLPDAWRESLGEVEQLGEIEVEMADQSVKKACVCGPLRVRIGEFRPIVAEVLFLDMEPDDDGEYEPLVGYIALEQAGARRGHARSPPRPRQASRPRMSLASDKQWAKFSLLECDRFARAKQPQMVGVSRDGLSHRRSPEVING